MAFREVSSVGEFGTYTLTASTNAIESSTPGDAEFDGLHHDLPRGQVSSLADFER
jgi:hypothetical protein